jgi:hypothetical protein
VYTPHSSSPTHSHSVRLHFVAHSQSTHTTVLHPRVRSPPHHVTHNVHRYGPPVASPRHTTLFKTSDVCRSNTSETAVSCLSRTPTLSTRRQTCAAATRQRPQSPASAERRHSLSQQHDLLLTDLTSTVCSSQTGRATQLAPHKRTHTQLHTHHNIKHNLASHSASVLHVPNSVNRSYVKLYLL